MLSYWYPFQQPLAMPTQAMVSDLQETDQGYHGTVCLRIAESINFPADQRSTWREMALFHDPNCGILMLSMARGIGALLY